MQKLNKTFRNKDMPTNVLAFPNIGIGADDELGDIAINTDAVTRESNQKNITTRDRFLHLLAHGLCIFLDMITKKIMKQKPWKNLK